jgi:hypothetical protein
MIKIQTPLGRKVTEAGIAEKVAAVEVDAGFVEVIFGDEVLWSARRRHAVAWCSCLVTTRIFSFFEAPKFSILQPPWKMTPF